MRKFNPEKELYKIQHGNKNKMILFVVLLIIVSVISYSFALYQVRYSKRIIYTKVAPFSIRDIDLAVKVDGEGTTRTSFPSNNEGLVYYNLDCNTPNITTASWDYTKWGLNLFSTGPNKCTVIFKKGQLLIKYLEQLSDKNFESDNTSDANKRYTGANPNNYIWFNCSDYNNITKNNAESEKQCEKWRIVGLFNSVSKSDGSTENLVKIIRAEKIGSYIAFDENISNNWANASLNTLLNSKYYTGIAVEDTKGITNNTKEKIEKVKWRTGGHTTHAITASQFYSYEKSKTVDGFIGLLLPSDYGYATDGGTIGRNSCLSRPLSNWNEGSYQANCAANDWLKHPESEIWTLTPRTDTSNNGYVISQDGSIPEWGLATVTRIVYPVLYLNSNTVVLGGTGTSTDPYIIR